LTRCRGQLSFACLRIHPVQRCGSFHESAGSSVRVAYIIENVSLKLTGVAHSAPGLTKALHKLGLTVRVVARCPRSELADRRDQYGGLGQFFPQRNGAGDFFRAIDQAAEWADLVHISGVWDPSTRRATSAARRSGKPFLFSPRGMLDPVRLRRKRLKKSLYCWLIARPAYARAAAVHALVEEELRHLRKWGYRGKVIVVPNGVELPSGPEDPEPFYRRCPEARGKRVILYLSRIDRLKGPMELVTAAGPILAERPDTVLVMAGNTQEPRFLSRLKRFVEDQGHQDRVIFPGFLAGASKDAALRAACLFVLPSHTEGFSNAVLEAMANARACLVTPYCNFPEIAQVHPGLCVEPTVPELRSALRSLLAKTRPQLDAIGQSLREIVKAKYTWDAVARRMAEEYRTILREHRRDRGARTD